MIHSPILYHIIDSFICYKVKVIARCTRTLLSVTALLQSYCWPCCGFLHRYVYKERPYLAGVWEL